MKCMCNCLASLVIVLVCGVHAVVAAPIVWNMEELYRVPAMTPTTELAVDGMKSFFYEGINYEGRPVKVYAYYKAPAGTPPKGGWPAVVCAHGGGGTAFYEWVQKWVDHGYAAIAMDLEGHLPELSKNYTERSGFKGAGPARNGAFGDFEKPVGEQWFYQAISQIIRAHSLMRSFPEVNPNQTGITGISWGGILTSAVMQVDPRFKFAVPVYGCGFLAGSGGHIDRNMPNAGQKQVSDLFIGQPVGYSNVTMPVFFINGTNDKFFPLPATDQTAKAVQGPVDFLFPVRMAHGHKPGWDTEEIYVFANSVIKGDEPLPQVGVVVREGQDASVSVTGKIVSAELCFTKDSGQWDLREWKTVPATVEEGRVNAKISKQTTGFFFTLMDERGMRVSSSYQTSEESIKQ